jgi:hypothetical protein
MGGDIMTTLKIKTLHALYEREYPSNSEALKASYRILKRLGNGCPALVSIINQSSNRGF